MTAKTPKPRSLYPIRPGVGARTAPPAFTPRRRRPSPGAHRARRPRPRNGAGRRPAVEGRRSGAHGAAGRREGRPSPEAIAELAKAVQGPEADLAWVCRRDGRGRPGRQGVDGGPSRIRGDARQAGRAGPSRGIEGERRKRAVRLSRQGAGGDYLPLPAVVARRAGLPPAAAGYSAGPGRGGDVRRMSSCRAASIPWVTFRSSAAAAACRSACSRAAFLSSAA